MKYRKGKLKQMLSVLLAAAMLITSVPLTGMTAYAAEVTGGEDGEAGAEVPGTVNCEVTFSITNATVTDVMAAGSEVTLTENKTTVASGSSLTFKVGADEGYTVTSVKAGDTTLTADADNVYRIENITGALTVTVETTPGGESGNAGDSDPADEEGDAQEDTYEVTFSAANATVTNVMAAGSEVTLTENKITVASGNSLTFKVGAVEGYTVMSVKAGDTTLTADADNVYKIENITGTLTVTVETALAGESGNTGDPDPADEEGDVREDTYEVTFSAANATVTDVSVAESEVTLTENKITVASGSSLTFKVNAADGYAVKSVKAGDTTLIADEDGIYKIESIAVALTIAIETEQVHTVTFSGSDYKLVQTYVNEDEVTVSDGKIVVPDKAELTFELNVGADYQLKGVSVSDTALLPDKNGVYKIENIENDLNVSIETEAIPKYTITIVGENSTWTAKTSDADGMIDVLGANQSEYQIKKGEIFYFKPAAEDGYRLATVKVNDTEYTEDTDYRAYKFDNITKDMTINVETIKLWQVGFTYEKSEAKVVIVGADGTEDAYDEACDENGKLKIADRQSLKFKITPDTFCTVESVAFMPDAKEGAEEGAEEPAAIPLILKDGYYELTDIQADGTINIDTNVEEDSNSITINDFQYMSDDDNFDLSKVNLSITVDGKAVKPGDTVRTNKDSIMLKISTLNCAYDASVKLEMESDAGSVISYYLIKNSDEREVSFSEDKRSATLEISVVPKKQFLIDNASDEFTYSVGVDGSNNVVLLDAYDSIFAVDMYTTAINIRVEVNKKSIYQPKVVLGDETLELVDTEELTDGKTLVYCYSFIPDKLKKTTDKDIVFLHITQEKMSSYIIVEGDDIDDAAQLKVSYDGQYISPLPADKAAELLEEKEGFVYAVAPKAKVSITAEPRDMWKLTAARVQSKKDDEWTKARNINIKKSGFTYTLTASGTDRLTIDTKAEPKMEGFGRFISVEYPIEIIEPVKGIYYVEAGEAYKPVVSTSDFMIRDMTGEINIKNQAAATAFDNETGLITIDAKDAGKTLTVNLKYKDEIYASFKLYVRPYADKIKVSGVSKGEIKQQIGSRIEYDISSVKPANALKEYGVAYSGDNGIEAETTSDSKLVIDTTKAKVGDTIDLEVKAWNGTDYVEVEGGSIKVTATAPKLPKPTVKLVSSDDTSLTLLLDSKTPEQKAEDVFYCVTVTPTEQKGKERPAEISAEPIVAYIPWAAKKTKTITVSTAEKGTGKGWKFDIRADIIYRPAEGSSEETESFAGDLSKKISASTKDACYETNLKFKQNSKAKKIYTGQTIELGTVQFSKNTTFTDHLYAEDMTAALKGEEGLDLWFEGNKLYAEVPIGGSGYDNLLGTHEIWITAETPSDSIGSIVKVKVTVIPSICDMSITGEPVTLYKKNNTAATLKLDLKYYYADSSVSPATKKATWSVKNADGQDFKPGDPLYGMITVKNGKVTVNKKYVLSANPEDNKFTVRADAADYQDNPVYDDSFCIELVAQKDVIDEVLLLGKVADDRYVPMAENGDTLTQTMLFGYEWVYVAVKRAGSESKAAYTYDEIIYGDNGYFIPSGNIKLSTSGKGFMLDTDGIVIPYSMKAGKSVTINAETCDGGKQKAKMKLNIDYDKEQNLGMFLDLVLADNIKVDGVPLENPEFSFIEGKLADNPGQVSVSYSGIPGYSMAVVAVVDYDHPTITPANKDTRKYDIKIDGAAALPYMTYGYITYDNISYYIFYLEEKDTTVTLTDTITGDKISYVLHNDKVSKIPAPDIKAETKNIKAGFAAFDPQDRPALHLTLPAKKGGYKDTYIALNPKMEKAIENMDGYEVLYDEICHDVYDVAPDGTVTIPLGTENSDTGLFETNLIEGTYEMEVSIYTDTEGISIPTPLAQRATIKLDIKKEKVSASFKCPTNISLKKEPGASADLKVTYKPKDMQYDVLGLLNAVSGADNNKFTKYFDFDSNDTGTGYVLKIKDSVTMEELEEIKKEDLTGYVMVEAYTKDHSFYKYDVVKITVKLK